MVQQLAELKAQKAAAYSRNLALEKLFQLQRLQESDRAQGSDASSSLLSSDHTQADSSISSEPTQRIRSNPIHLSVDVDALARSYKGHQISPSATCFSKAMLERLEFADFARLWKEYISRYSSHRYICIEQQAHTIALHGNTFLKLQISLHY